MNRIARAMTLAAVVTSVGIASATDGTFWGKSDNGTLNWSSRANWFNHTYACDGGVAWFNSSQLNEINVDVEGITLTGLSFDGRWMKVTGDPLTFTAPNSWITRSSYTYSTHTPGFDVMFRGTGDNAVTITDNGEFHMAVPAENVGNLRLMGNRVMAWNTSGDCLTKGNLQLLEGTFAVTPKSTAGAAANVTVASVEGKAFTYGPSVGLLQLDKGGGDSLTLTIGKLARFADGGAMMLEAKSGLENLGGTEKLLVAEGAPANVNGICDASIVARSTDSPPRLEFLTYDETDGFKKSAVTPVAFADATATDVALIDGNTTISNTKAVYALEVQGEPTITFAENAVLKVGDGVHPAGVIFNPVNGNRIQPALVGATGTIDFGGSLGCIYYNNPANSPTLTVNPAIAGTGGMLFASAGNGTKNYIQLKQSARWTGATVVSRATLCVTAANQLPESGDVYVLGGRDGQKGACLRLTETVTFGENQRFHFGGWGASSDYAAAIHTGGYLPVFTFNGPVVLDGPGGVVDDGVDNKTIFNGTVSGYGWWRFGQGQTVFRRPMEYTGVFLPSKTTTQIVFEGAGRPHAASSVKFESTGATLVFRSLTSPFDFASTVTGKGNLVVTDAEVALSGTQAYGTITVNAGAKVGFGTNVTFDRIVSAGGEVYALEGADDMSLRIGGNDGVDQLLNGTISIADSLGLFKQGSNTVSIARDANVAKSLHIADGTVKLDNRLVATADVSYWLDASNEATVTADAEGHATQWVSANGNGATFNATTKTPMYTNSVNGLKVMSFENDGENYNRFNSTGSYVQRAMFFCLAPQVPSRGAQSLSAWGWTGKGQTEQGLRYQPYSGGWGTLNYASAFRLNGQANKYSFTPNGTAQIVGEFIADTATEDFPASVGGYEGWSVANNYNGDICEVIAFRRDVTAEEIDEVENYLAEKWGLTDLVWHEGVTEKEVLKSTVAVTLAPSGVFDLNGVSQTIASLAGEGTITNSSAKAAVLTVTGACEFRGRIAGNVTVRTSGGVLEVEVPDAAIEAADGVTSLGVYTEMPPTNGILYWLDAAWTAPDAITWQDAGAKTVASAKSRAGSVKSFPAYNGYPTFVENAIGGNKPAFRFTGASSTGVPAFKTGSAVSTKTIVLVMQLPDNTYGSNYFWGRAGKDKGFRLSSKTNFDLGYGFQNWGYAFSSVGDYRWFNGEKKQVAYNQGGFAMTVGEPARLIATRAAWHQDDSYENVTDGIGSYENRDCNMYIAEAISYDHVLSDNEVAHLEGYLKAKWFSAEPIPAVRTQVFGADSTLAAAGGEVDLSGLSGVVVGTLKSGSAGGTVTGDLTISGFSYDAEGATAAVPLAVDGALTIAEGADFTATGLENLKRTSWTLLSSESATGAFETFSAGPRKWTFDAKATSWGLGVPGLLLFFK